MSRRLAVRNVAGLIGDRSLRHLIQYSADRLYGSMALVAQGWINDSIGQAGAAMSKESAVGAPIDL